MPEPLGRMMEALASYEMPPPGARLECLRMDAAAGSSPALSNERRLSGVSLPARALGPETSLCLGRQAAPASS
jgi:hypothetical protein